MDPKDTPANYWGLADDQLKPLKFVFKHKPVLVRDPETGEAWMEIHPDDAHFLDDEKDADE